MPSTVVRYSDSTSGHPIAECEGYLAAPEGPGARPLVLVCHAWAGQDDFAREKADMLASLGYVGFALDVYGNGKRGSSTEENSALMKPFVESRTMLRERLLAGFRAGVAQKGVDSSRVGAIGFCFGGLCALDLARAVPSGLRGVVAFHGLFAPPKISPQAKITARVLALHGYDDPMCTPDAVAGLAKEMTDAGADWEIDMYGHTSHAFTNPQANDRSLGLVFRQRASDRAFARMEDFFSEVFASER